MVFQMLSCAATDTDIWKPKNTCTRIYKKKIKKLWAGGGWVGGGACFKLFLFLLFACAVVLCVWGGGFSRDNAFGIATVSMFVVVVAVFILFLFFIKQPRKG